MGWGGVRGVVFDWCNAVLWFDYVCVFPWGFRHRVILLSDICLRCVFVLASIEIVGWCYLYMQGHELDL